MLVLTPVARGRPDSPEEVRGPTRKFIAFNPYFDFCVNLRCPLFIRWAGGYSGIDPESPSRKLLERRADRFPCAVRAGSMLIPVGGGVDFADLANFIVQI